MKLSIKIEIKKEFKGRFVRSFLFGLVGSVLATLCLFWMGHRRSLGDIVILCVFTSLGNAMVACCTQVKFFEEER